MRIGSWGPRGVLCGGKNCKNWDRGTILVSSWSEFRTKASGLFFFPLSIFRRDKKNGSSTAGAPGGLTPRIHRERALTRFSAPRVAVGAPGGDGAVRQPLRPRVCDTTPTGETPVPWVCDTIPAGEARQGGPQEGLPALGYVGAPEGAWKRWLMRIPCVALQVCSPLLSLVLWQILPKHICT